MASRQLQQDDSEKEENEDNFDRKKVLFTLTNNFRKKTNKIRGK
jgi:hypothetical protein